MSSDSEDDFSYTNSVSVLKAITKDINISTEYDKNIDKLYNLDSSETSPFNFDAGSTSFINDDIEESFTTDSSIICNNDLCVLVSDDEVDITPQTTDNILENGKKKRYRTTSKRITRQTLRNQKKAKTNVPQIFPVIETCVIESDEELDKTPVSIISTIDNILQKGTKKRSKAASKRITRQAARKNKLNKSAEKAKTKVCLVEETFDSQDVNYEIPIKVWWKSQYVEKFTLRRFEKICNIFKYFSEKENVSEDRLLFSIGNKILSKTDTPDSLNINAATIIEGGVLSEKTQLTSSNQYEEDKIELKVQLKDRKHALTISLRTTDRMEILMFKCAEELQVANNLLKFYFDGDLIKTSDTPKDLQLEDGECIDCIQK